MNRELSIQDFENWIYKNDSQLESELQTTLYFDLISFNYQQKDSLQQLEIKLTPYFDREEYGIWCTKRLLEAIIEDKIDLVLATRKLRALYFDTGEKLIPITLGIGYESEIGDYPTPDEYQQWNESALKEKLKEVQSYREDIIKDSNEFLSELKEKEKTAANKG